MTAPYTTGTVSVTAGSTVVTGAGTGWQTALVAGGLFGLDSANGNPVPILSVDSDTQITLAKPWRGTTVAGQAYWIIRDTAYGQQTVANANALAQIITELRASVIAALAGLTPQADRVPVFTGPNTASLATLTAFGRSFLAAANGGAGYGVLGGIPDGQLPDRLKANAIAVSDLNSITDSGFYRIAGTEGGNPVGVSGVVLHIQYDSSAALQVFWRGGASPQRLSRWKWGGTWTSWDYSSDRLVGAVSQASGQPTGAAFEKGSTANGQYQRTADGWQKCTKTISGLGPIDQPHGNIFISAQISLGDWAAPFSGKPVRLVTSQGLTQASWIYGNTAPSATSAGSVTLARGTASSMTNFEIGVEAEGSWN